MLVTEQLTDLIGRSKATGAVIESIARANALNLTGDLNYNTYGSKDAHGFQQVTEKFIDNFLLHAVVPEYYVKNGKNIFVGGMNKTIRDLLTASNLTNCVVKAVSLGKVEHPTKTMVDSAPHLDPKLEPAASYHIQQFKVACPNLEYDKVIDFLRKKDYVTHGYHLKDLDVTMDYSGSFSKSELVEHLINTKGFRLQGEEDDGDRTILNNDNFVGKNCLTFMESISGIVTRQKIYNKMVQMIECKSVRSGVGCHLKDWACQTGTRLAEARDAAKSRGLTRAEVTFYCEDNDIPTDEFIDRIVNRLTEYIPAVLVFATPYSATWKAYCEILKHSLVVIDRTANIGLLVYSLNEYTRKLSGHVFNNWSKDEMWILLNLTLNGVLPLDVIDVVTTTKTMMTRTMKKSGNKLMHCDKILEIAGSRYFKVHNDHTTHFTTRLVSKGGRFSYNSATVSENSTILKAAGFQEEPNCVLYLSSTSANVNTKVKGMLHKVDTLKVMLPESKRKKGPSDNDENATKIVVQAAIKIDKIRAPLLAELETKAARLKKVQDYTEQLQTRDSHHLTTLNQGKYVLHAARKVSSRYGPQYKLLLEHDDYERNIVVWGNTQVTRALDSITDESRLVLTETGSGCLMLYQHPIGSLTVTGRGRNYFGGLSVYVAIEIDIPDPEQSVNEVLSKAQVSKIWFLFPLLVQFSHSKRTNPFLF